MEVRRNDGKTSLLVSSGKVKPPKNEPQLSKYCAYCNIKLNGETKQTIVKCQQCKHVTYCSVECRQADWDGDHEFDKCSKTVLHPPYRPRGTDALYGHHKDDLIIIYMRVKDGYNLDKDEDQFLFIPQWFRIDCVNENRGISLPLKEQIKCTYEEMEGFARGQLLANKIYIHVRKVFFLHVEGIISIRGVRPFCEMIPLAKVTL